MKQKLLFSISLLFFIFSIPLLISTKELININSKLKFELPKINLNFFKPQNTKSSIENDSTNYIFKILDKSTNTVFSVTLKDFTYGTVATEMPITFETEALKAQAVAAFTYFCNLKEKNAQNPDPNLNGADFSVDSSKWLYFVSKEQMQSRWGDNFDFYYNKLSQAVDPVLGECLKYDKNYIEALYHSISSGNTENIEDVFGGKHEYLKSVPCPGDLLAPGYLSKKEFSVENFKNIAKSKWPDINFEPENKNLLQINKKTHSGMILEAKIGSMSTSGREIRELFSLRSANFDINIQEDKIEFIVKGHGHGVGMSQYGAQNMAKQGASYKQILAWFYPNTTLCSF